MVVGLNERLIELNEDVAALDFDRISFQVHTHRRALGLTGGEIKTSVVLGTLDDVFHHQTARQMHLAVGAESVSGVKFVIGGPVNGIGLPGVIEAQDISTAQVLIQWSLMMGWWSLIDWPGWRWGQWSEKVWPKAAARV